ncbi:MAG: type II toxin-antitoxin system RelE/ParE family toxin [Chloroflexota bacterium]
MTRATNKDLIWVGSSLKDLRGFPDDVKRAMGYALHVAQKGGKHPNAKPLKGFGGAGVLEVAEYHEGDAYRTVYTVTLGDTVYVLHAFEKKSKRGIATPKRDLDLIRQRLNEAHTIHDQRRASRGEQP